MTAARYSSIWFRSWRIIKDRRGDDDFKRGDVRGDAARNEVMGTLSASQRADFVKAERVLVRWFRGRFQFRFAFPGRSYPDDV